MSGNFWRFFRALAVWEALVFLPVGIALLRRGMPMQAGDLAWALPIAICGVPIIVICSLLAGKIGPIASVSLGVLSGVILMIAGEFVWAHLVRGFEASAGAFAGSLLLAVPSGVGGGVASWLSSRS